MISLLLMSLVICRTKRLSLSSLITAVLDDEDSNNITAGSIVTVTVTLTRKRMSVRSAPVPTCSQCFSARKSHVRVELFDELRQRWPRAANLRHQFTYGCEPSVCAGGVRKRAGGVVEPNRRSCPSRGSGKATPTPDAHVVSATRR